MRVAPAPGCALFVRDTHVARGCSVVAVGIENLEERMETTSFPWILTNAFDKVSGLPLASCHEALVIDWHGVKIGLMGLIEREWLETLPTIDPSDVDYVDFVEVAREKAREMRGDGVDLVIALTHMRVRNDEKLAKEVGRACPRRTSPPPPR